MSWLVVGIVYGCVLHYANPDPGDPEEEERRKREKGKKGAKRFSVRQYWIFVKQYLLDGAACESSAPDMAVLVITLLCSPPAIGGMVLVGLMIGEYGTCTPIG